MQCVASGKNVSIDLSEDFGGRLALPFRHSSSLLLSGIIFITLGGMLYQIQIIQCIKYNVSRFVFITEQKSARRAVKGLRFRGNTVCFVLQLLTISSEIDYSFYLSRLTRQIITHQGKQKILSWIY